MLVPSIAGEEYELPALIVIAPYLGTPMNELPQRVEVISREEIESRRPERFTELFQDLPGLDIANSGTLRRNSTLIIRGADPEHTLVLFDGMDASDPLAPSGTLPLDLLASEDVERIEVIKGPQSVLYGSKAIGGVVNVVTRRGSGRTQGSLGVGGGNLDSRRFRQGVSGSVGGAHYSATAAQHFSSGWGNARESGEDSAGAYSNPEKDGFSSGLLSGRAGYQSRYWDVDVFGRNHESRREADNGPGRGGDDPNREETYRTGSYQAQFNARFLDGRLRQRFAASHGRYFSDIHNPADADHPTDFLFSDFRAVNNRFDWRWEWTGRWERLTAGYSRSLEKGDSQELGTGSVGFTTVSGVRAEQIGRYAQGHAVFDGPLINASAGLGGRHESHSRGLSETTYSIGSKFGWKPTRTSVRWNQGTGFRVPGLSALFSAIGNPDLKPERALGREAVLEQTIIERDDLSVSGSWAWFRNDVNELITFDFASFRLVNVESVVLRGNELEIAARWRRWSVSGSYTSQKAVDRTGGADGPPLLNRADRKATGSIGYDHRSWGARVFQSYVGKRPDKNAASERVILGSYSLVDVSAWFDVRRFLTLRFSVKNLLDEDYEELLGFGAPPRQIQAGVDLRFG